MNKKKEIFPKLRFRGYKSKWIVDSFNFEFLQTNSFSRAEMDDEKGSVKNIHYGDILTKYNDILRDLSAVPFVNKNIDLSKFEEESYLKNGDIVIADTAEDFTAGKAVEVQNIDFPVLAGQHTFLCRPKISFAPGYMGYYLNSPSYHNRLVPLLTGTKVYSISKSNIKNTFILYPKNYEEQQRIADCLSSIDELIDAESRKLIALEKYKKGLMQKLFPAEGKTLPEWRFPEFQGCGKWQESTIAEVTSYVDYRGKTPVKAKDGIFLVTAKNIKMGYIDYNASKEYIPKDQYLTVMSRGIPQLGDVLITTEAPCGNVAQIDKVDVALAQRVIKYRGDKNKINNTFLKYVFLSPPFQSELKKNSTGGIVGGIKGSVLHQMSIKFPYDIIEQQKIADCLSDIDTMISEQSNKVEQLKTHKKGLMQGLFPSLEEADV